jgi:hypothetical protein
LLNKCNKPYFETAYLAENVKKMLKEKVAKQQISPNLVTLVQMNMKHGKVSNNKSKQHYLRLIYTRNVCSAISLSDVISTEDFLSPQIAITSNSDKYLLLSYLCKHRFRTK